MAQRTGDAAARIYEASRRFVDQALRQDGSLFTPGQSIWNRRVLADLDERFAQRPDTSSDKFDVKFLRQLAGAPNETIQLAGELLYVHLLITLQLRGQTKRELITKILQAASTPVVIPDDLQPALDGGLCNAGQGFLRYRHAQLIFLIEFAKAWKTRPQADVEHLLSDPWAFRDAVFSLPGGAARLQQHALIHLVYPDAFEPIVSEPHKGLIVEHFRSLVSDSTQNLDRQLFEIRQQLSTEFGPTFTFYQGDVKRQWLPRTAEEEPTEPDAPDAGPTGLRYWVEKTLVTGRLDRGGGTDALGRALWSPQRSEDGREYYRAMEQVQPGDVVLHFVDNRHFAGVSRAATAVDRTFIGLPDTDWAGRPAFRIELADYEPLAPPIEREELFQNPDVRRRVQEIVASHRGLFFNKKLELNQGSYLTEAPKALVSLLNELYHARTGRSLPHVEVQPAPEPRIAPAGAALTLSWLADQTLWTPERLQEVIDALVRTPQIVLAGPPGTGKTWVAQLLAQFLTQGQSKRQRLVQLHPSYSYEAFMEGLRPVVERGAVQFKPVDGVVPAFVKDMRNSDEPHVLVVDEMNRANLPKVLGELMYLFEYRNQLIDLPYTKGFRLPPNLWFIGTMNTADRSIRAIDIALRRRFDIFECPPDLDALQRYYETHENRVDSLFDGLRTLNAELETGLDRHHTIGHTFFMAPVMTVETLLKVWRHKIGPLVEEYFFDRPDEAVRMNDPARFWPELRQ